MCHESVTEPLALVSETMVTDQEREPLSPVLGIEIINQHIESSSSASESILFKVGVSIAAPEYTPFEAKVPIQEDLEAPMVGPMPIVLKESMVLIVESRCYKRMCLLNLR